MTQQEVHEMLCNAPDEQKMQLALQCQLRGVDIQSVEKCLANALTLAMSAIQPALDTYKYLNGGTDYGRKENVRKNNNRQ